MKARESALWNWLLGAGDDVFMARVENAVNTGFPDVVSPRFVCELKSLPRPRRPNGRIDTKLTAEQAGFLREWSRHGGSSWLLIQIGFGRAARRYLIPGFYADRFVEGGETTENMMVMASECDPSDTASLIVDIMDSGK